MHTGLAPSLSIAENLVLRSYRRAPMATRLVPAPQPHPRARRAGHPSASDIRAPGPNTPARLLSGGNAQKVILAREFEGRPRALVVAAPTRGLDVGATESVRGLLAARRARAPACC